MRSIQTVAPTEEPITLSALKLFLRQDCGVFSDAVSLTTSIAAGSHAVTVGYTLLGTAVEVLGYETVVYLQPTDNGALGTVDAKIQESDDNLVWLDWAGGAFTQVTEANDTVIQEKEYTGVKRYVRVAAKTLVSTCSFGVSILVNTGITVEDDTLTEMISSAREIAEDRTSRALLTQTWAYYLSEFPSENYIKLPYGNLQSVTSVTYKTSDGTEVAMVEGTDYLVEDNGDQCGRLVLPYATYWPVATLYPSKPITVTFVCGWESASDLPKKLLSAIKLLCADLYMNREAQTISNLIQDYIVNRNVDRVFENLRLRDEF